DEPFQIRAAALEAILTDAGVERRSGDILLLRTGWESGYRAADADRRVRATSARCPGLGGGEEMLEFLWDWGVGAVASDNPTLECWPIGDAFLHPRLLGRLGIPIGELWWLDELARRSHADGRFTCFLTSAPLNVSGGIGSPANALAIR
ncbi:MAG: cyclase family protein, partial [Microbacterium sp.]